MRYYELTEGRSEAIDEGQAMNILRKQCSSAFKAPEIFRGVKSNNQFMLVNPQQFTRKSKNTSNYHTLLVDNMASWETFPKRSESIVCSTSRNKAAVYGAGGMTYRVLPINGSNIGICAEDDWWFSFKKFDNLGITVRDFNEDLANMFNTVLNDLPDDDNWEMVAEWIEMVDERLVVDDSFLSSDFADYLFEHDKTVKQTLIDLLEPKSNGFELTTIENFTTTGNHEIWTDGPSLLVADYVYDDFIGDRTL